MFGTEEEDGHLKEKKVREGALTQISNIWPVLPGAKKNPCNQLLDSVCCKDFGEVPGGLEPP